MSPILQAFLAILGGFIASSGGFWVYMRRRFEQKDFVEKLIMGLAHDKIMCLSIEYIEQGYINADEYSDLMKYFWEPYTALGGNSSAARVISLVQTLPLLPERRYEPHVRAASDALPEGAKNVIEKIEEGDDRFEPPPKRRPAGPNRPGRFSEQ